VGDCDNCCADDHIDVDGENVDQKRTSHLQQIALCHDLFQYRLIDIDGIINIYFEPASSNYIQKKLSSKPVGYNWSTFSKAKAPKL
jgi:hypothetical protein